MHVKSIRSICHWISPPHTQQREDQTAMVTNVTSLVGDSGAVFTIETTRNSELIDIIFMNFALKMEKRTSAKVLTNNYENKASL